MDQGFTEGEWDYIRRLTSWATNTVDLEECSDKQSKEHSAGEKKEESTTKIVNADTLTFNDVTIDYIPQFSDLFYMFQRES